jgi:hypothetical protein
MPRRRAWLAQPLAVVDASAARLVVVAADESIIDSLLYIMAFSRFTVGSALTAFCTVSVADRSVCGSDATSSAENRVFIYELLCTLIIEVRVQLLQITAGNQRLVLIIIDRVGYVVGQCKAGRQFGVDQLIPVVSAQPHADLPVVHLSTYTWRTQPHPLTHNPLAINAANAACPSPNTNHISAATNFTNTTDKSNSFIFSRTPFTSSPGNSVCVCA